MKQFHHTEPVLASFDCVAGTIKANMNLSAEGMSFYIGILMARHSSHLRYLAEQAHLAAEEMTVPESKTMMLEIAAAYLKQADRSDGEPVQVHLLNEQPPEPGEDVEKG